MPCYCMSTNWLPVVADSNPACAHVHVVLAAIDTVALVITHHLQPEYQVSESVRKRTSVCYGAAAAEASLGE